MIPISDDNPTRIKPYVVYALIAINVLVYIIDHVGATNAFGRLWNWSMVPYSVISDVRVVPVLNQVGQIVGFSKAPEVGPHPQWITIFSSMFLHGGLAHIGGNMLFLWIFGNNIEDTLGHFKFILFYLACGVLAAITHIVVSFMGGSQFIPTVGASGAIAGVLGAYLILFPQARVRTLVLFWIIWHFVEIPAVFVLGVWFLTQLTGILGTGGQVGGGVAYGAHIGGFIAGVILILLVGGRRLINRRPRRYYRAYDDDQPYPWRKRD